jgi:hypothetical protein
VIIGNARGKTNPAEKPHQLCANLDPRTQAIQRQTMKPNDWILKNFGVSF